MRISVLVAGALSVAAFAVPAWADTAQEIASHGFVLSLPTFTVDFTPDGKFASPNGQLAGTWRVDGDKICTTPSTTQIEGCLPVPPGKKSGDSFDLTLPAGPATVKIK